MYRTRLRSQKGFSLISTTITELKNDQAIAPAGAGHRLPVSRTDPRTSTDTCAIIFNHIYKCAGTTFADILRKNFGNAFFDATFLKSWVTLRQPLTKQSHRNIAIAGHAAWGMHNLLPPTCRPCYVTLLRQPWERFLSEYRFLRSRFSPVSSLDEFLRMHHRNFMTDWLGAGSLEKAKESLQSDYILFGTVERFDNFLAIITDKFNMNITDYTALNRTKKESTGYADQMKADFSELNSLDMELYNWASAEFEKRYRAFIKAGGRPFLKNENPAEHSNKSRNTPSKAIRTLLDSGKSDTAVTLLEACEEERTPPHCVYLAENCLNAGQPEKAEQWFLKAADMDPDMVFELVNHYLAANRPFDAIRALQNAMNTIGDSYPCDSYAGRFIARAGTAIADCKQKAAVHIKTEFLDGWQKMAGDRSHPTLRVAIYGAGTHTVWLENISADRPGPDVAAVLDDNPDPSRSFWNLKPILPSECDISDIDAVIISSDTVSDQMSRRCLDLFGNRLPVINIYKNKPAGPYPKT